MNDRQFLVIEPDNLGDGLPVPRFKKVFLLDTSQAAGRDRYVRKTLLVASDNNLPTSSGRSRSLVVDRSGPLDVDRRLLPATGKPPKR